MATVKGATSSQVSQLVDYSDRWLAIFEVLLQMDAIVGEIGRSYIDQLLL